MSRFHFRDPENGSLSDFVMVSCRIGRRRSPSPRQPQVIPRSDDATAVSVLMRRTMATNGRWSVPRWELVEVLAGADDGIVGATVVRREGERLDVLWSGLRVELWRDACEGYWANLVSGRPRLFVACFVDDAADDAAQELAPAAVTASQEEASAHLESDDEVYSLPMPAAMIEWVEGFVVAHYEPGYKKKRKRSDWREEGGGDEQRRARAPRAS